MPADNAASNQRVTNAVLKRDMEYLTSLAVDIKDDFKDYREKTDGRLRDVEKDNTRQDTEINNLDKRVKLDIGGTAIGGLILAIAAAIGIKQ